MSDAFSPLAVISDIHSNIAALNAVLSDIEQRGITRIANLGDSLSGPFDGAATAQRLMPLNLPTVGGNHDRQLIDRPKSEMGLWECWVIDTLTNDMLNWIRATPATLELGDIFLCHATPDSDEENWLDYRGPQHRLVARDLPDVVLRAGNVSAPVICCGHTHAPRLVHLPTGQLVVNPGSVGCPAYLDSRMDPNFIHQTGSPDARYAIVTKSNTGWSADLIAVPYDASEMAALARQKDAESWAQAVETGWIA
ncbi:MAG: metallophosphoesterase [Boseongicola sp.]|nr:MAG: metallophosphoesterase [Boseongicola sp.]